MPYDLDGRKIRARRRQIYATLTDIVDFLNVVLESIPDAKLHCNFADDERNYPRTSVAEWAAADGQFHREIDILFYEGDWKPEYGPGHLIEVFPDDVRMTNFPSPSVSIGGYGTHSRYIEEIDLRIERASEEAINSNDLVDDPRGKKIVDKVFRLSGKIFSNKARWVDLFTGETVEEMRYYNWCGRDMARRCREEKNLFLDLWFNREQKIFRGLKPAD